MSEAPASAFGADVAPEEEQETPGNSLQRWESTTERYYRRKMSRELESSVRNPADRMRYRMQRRIAPGPDNIPGYGTPARPPVGMGTGADRGYASVTFKSGWSPY